MSDWSKFMTPIETRLGYIPNDITKPSILKPNPSITVGGTVLTDFEKQLLMIKGE